MFLIGGLEASVVDALPGALVAVARARSSARRRWPGPVLHGRQVVDEQVPVLAARSVHREPDGLCDAELISAAQAYGFAGLPVALTMTSTRCAVLTAHAVFDGTAALGLVHDLLDVAASVPLEAAVKGARLPVLQALRRLRPRDLGAFVDARRHRPAAPSGAGGTDTSTTRSVAFTLNDSDLAAVRRYREPARVGRATLHSRLASLTVAALREVAATGPDIPVWVTSDLRHLVDGRVDGNFISRELVGTLHGEQWAPGALAVRLVRLKSPGQALGLVWSTTGWLLRSAIGRRPVAGEEVVLTFASTQRALPVSVGSVTATSLGGSPTFAFVWQTRGAVHLSVHSTSGRFDLSRYEEAFRRLVRLRAGG